MFKKVLLVSLAFFFLLAVSGYAGEAAYEKHIAKGVLKLEEKEYQAAAGEFREAMKEKPEDAVATLYLGISLSRGNDNGAEAVLLKALSYNPREPRTNLELGIYYFNRGIRDEAEEYLKIAAGGAPGTEVAVKAEEYLTLLDRSGGRKKWTVNFTAGGQYDSNVVLGPDDGSLSTNISRESDWRTVLYLKGRYDLLKQQEGEAWAAYSIYQSIHNDLDEFDVTRHLAELRGDYKISPMFTLRGLYSTEYVYVGGDDYDYGLSISPSIRITEGRGMYSEVEYRFKHTRFMNSDFFPDNAERSGDNNLIGIVQSIPVSGTMHAKAGYYHDEDTAADDFWNYRGNKFLAGIRLLLPLRIIADVNGEYYNKKYEDSALTSGEFREDYVYTASLSATRIFTPGLSVTAGQIFIRNDSSAAEFDYKRSITSLFVNLKY